MAENAIRKDFLPSEIDAIRRALEPAEKEAANERRTANLPNAKVSHSGVGRSTDKIGAFAGVSGRTVEKIKGVVEAARLAKDQTAGLPGYVQLIDFLTCPVPARCFFPVSPVTRKLLKCIVPGCCPVAARFAPHTPYRAYRPRWGRDGRPLENKKKQTEKVPCDGALARLHAPPRGASGGTTREHHVPNVVILLT
ncbi:MAG: hypothetical protein IIA72_03220 [Proteobacteria bacterium]|nr:hypothetical protein [Pseudomonadota bacterium]